MIYILKNAEDAMESFDVMNNNELNENIRDEAYCTCRGSILEVMELIKKAINK
jgi:hypothetical protein